MKNLPRSERYHIGLFGKRNVGKSSFLNYLTNQELSIVSSIKGTTTDPIYKAMELFPIGPVVLIDTPGLDDEGELGKLRIKQTKKVLRRIDFAIILVENKLSQLEQDLINQFNTNHIPYLLIYTKNDLYTYDSKVLSININDHKYRDILLKQLGKLSIKKKPPLIKDLLNEKDICLLIIPIDTSAPSGRLILPQQLVIRELLDNHMIPMLTTVETLEKSISSLIQKPKLIVTDSQAFPLIKDKIDPSIALTSFSILFARYKGILKQAYQNVSYLDKLKDNDTILISEGCSHHRQCDDIGSIKIPNWINHYTNKHLHYAFTDGIEFPSDLSSYQMIIHCGGCMLNEKEIQARQIQAKQANIPFTNYGMVIAYTNGIFERSMELFKVIYYQ